jgi:hypothetical protein
MKPRSEPEAIEKAAAKLNVSATKLIATRRRCSPFAFDAAM